jgi:hypothetical protein
MRDYIFFRACLETEHFSSNIVSTTTFTLIPIAMATIHTGHKTKEDVGNEGVGERSQKRNVLLSFEHEGRIVEFIEGKCPDSILKFLGEERVFN